MNIIELDCGHNLYLETAPDTVDDTLWCGKCGEYRELAPTVAKLRGAWVYDVKEDFRSKRLALRKFLGECTVEGCDYSHTSWNGWFILRDTMHKHHMRTHTKRGTIEIEYVDTKLPRNSEPPF